MAGVFIPCIVLLGLWNPNQSIISIQFLCPRKHFIVMQLPRENLSVSSSLYTKEYFLTDCGGFEEFNTTHGENLSLRLSKALDLADVAPGERVLDLGCGRGEIVLHCLRRGAFAVGVDYSQAALKIASDVLRNGHGLVQSAGLLKGNGRFLCFADNTFDVVFLLDVVEHLYPWELELTLKEVRRILRPGGRAIIHTAPNRTFVDYGFRYYTRFWHQLFNRAFGKDYVLDLRPGISPLVHVNELTIQGLQRYLTSFSTRRAWLQVFLGDRMTMRTWIRGMVTHLFPLSAIWPLNRLFAYWIWAIVTK